MLDDELNCWLIEVNSSPSLECKGQPDLQDLVEACLSDLAKVIVDWNIDEDKCSDTDTGGFQLIHQAKNEVLRPAHVLTGQTLDLTVKGKKCKLRK